MFTEATIGIVVVNAKGLILYINKLAEVQFGYMVDELIDQPVDQLVPSNKKGHHHKHRDSYHKNPQPRLMGAGRELEGKRKDGSTFPIEISLSPVQVEGEHLVIAFVHDITERRKAEKRMTEEQVRAQTYLEMAGSLIVVLDKEENVALANKEAAAVLGLSEKDIVGKNWFDHFVLETDRESVRQVYDNIIEGKMDNIEYYENYVETKANGARLIRWYNRRIENEAGEITGIISSGVDITEQKAAKDALQNYTSDLEQAVAAKTRELVVSSAKLEQASNLVKMGYWEIDFKGEDSEVTFSREYCKLFGVTQEDCKGDRNYFLQFVEEEDKERVLDLTRKAIKEGNGLFQFKAFKKTGTQIYLQAELQCIYNDQNALETVFSVVQDITEQKQSEFQLEQALKKEQELGQLKSRFVSMASHEFRTPLTSILSSVSLIEMLKNKGKFDGQDKYIKRIESSVENMISILNDFLSLEKLESGKVITEKKEIDITEFVKELRDDVATLYKEGQTLVHNHEGEANFFADPHLMKNILLNLLSNAIKYSPENSIITINSIRQDELLRIDVVDKGIGIPFEDQKYMFSRFFRAHNASNIKGTGLGLTIVRRYLELMKGDITFESKENDGTTFKISIPQKSIST